MALATGLHSQDSVYFTQFPGRSFHQRACSKNLRVPSRSTIFVWPITHKIALPPCEPFNQIQAIPIGVTRLLLYSQRVALVAITYVTRTYSPLMCIYWSELSPIDAWNHVHDGAYDPRWQGPPWSIPRLNTYFRQICHHLNPSSSPIRSQPYHSHRNTYWFICSLGHHSTTHNHGGPLHVPTSYGPAHHAGQLWCACIQHQWFHIQLPMSIYW